MNTWTEHDLPKRFDDSLLPDQPWTPHPRMMRDLARWLNEHHPKPGRDFSGVDWRAQYERAEGKCAYWQARVEGAERERDEWKDRAEKYLNIASRRREHEELIDEIAEDVYGPPPTGGWHSTKSLAADVRALAAANAPVKGAAPEVTRADIEKVIDQALEKLVHGDWIPTAAADAVWSLVSGDDPAVFVVRESDVAAVEVERGDRKWIADGEIISDVDNGPDWVRESIGAYLRWTAESEAVARAIEAEAAVGPVEEQTDALADILYGDELVTDQMRGVLERVVRAGMLFPEQEADQ